MRLLINIIVSLLVCVSANSKELVYMDKAGVVRWHNDRSEIALFGANYCLPSACDFRAADMVNADKHKMVDQDMLHFSRMGWDALRLSFWGDWENCDTLGNLKDNAHLELLEYLIHKASERGIMMLLSPIVTYNANWPDQTAAGNMPGFSAYYPKWELITNSKAVAAQVNYIKSLLNHTNRYSGLKIKDEPNIIFIEIINEPTQHTDKIAQTTSYINTMCDAVRSTGCEKLLFYNLSQDFGIAPAITASKVQGCSYAWYPTQLNIGYTLKGNFLPYVASYDKMKNIEIGKRAKIVYEFDTPDVSASYLYPAIVREYRKGGVQFAALFSYDMLATAPWNLGWQTHNFNMVYTPQKSISAMIAAQAMKRLPLNYDHGDYPDNNSFGDFYVSYQDNLSLLNSNKMLLYSNNISDSIIVSPNLKKIVGYGSSPVVDYDGQGVYFLDKIKEGLWRLELYPDAVQISDPFAMPNPNKLCNDVIWREHKIGISLSDLGLNFHVIPIGESNEHRPKVENGGFSVSPGVYLISDTEQVSMQSLPQTIDGIGLAEFIAPQTIFPNMQKLIHTPEHEYIAGDAVEIRCNVYTIKAPQEVAIYTKTLESGSFKKSVMKQTSSYGYQAIISGKKSKSTLMEYIITVDNGNSTTMYPSGICGTPSDWSFYKQPCYTVNISDKDTALLLFDARTDRTAMRYTRVFKSPDFKHNFIVVPSDGRLALEMTCNDISARDTYLYPSDVSSSLLIANRLAARNSIKSIPVAIEIDVRATTQTTDSMTISFNQSDCYVWSATIPLSTRWQKISVGANTLKPGMAPMLPQDWPGVNPYWYPRPLQQSTINWSKIENIFFSLRAESFTDSGKHPKGIQIRSVTLSY